jgi:hypothetical protein
MKETEARTKAENLIGKKMFSTGDEKDSNCVIFYNEKGKNITAGFGSSWEEAYEDCKKRFGGNT